MKIVPCPLCGYDALRAGAAGAAARDSAARDSAAREPTARDPGSAAICPHCALEPREPSLRAPRARLRGGVLVGLSAVPQGLYFLASTPGVKRWLIPPLALTVLAFCALFWWLWGLV